MSTLVTIATYEQSITAYILKAKLEDENIDCYFAILSSAEEEWEEVRVQVNEQDVERAIKVMLSIQAEYGVGIEEIKTLQPSRKIIVPTDFSTGAEYACHYAIHLAHKLKAEIKLLHVYEDPVTDLSIKESATYVSYLQSALREVEKRANIAMVQFIRKMKSYMKSQKIKNVRIHSSIARGSIVETIKSISAVYKPDLLVLGTIGRREDSKSVFSGLTKLLISGLHIPVYAIPGPVHADDFKSVNILYATDFNERDHNSLEQLLKIVEPFEKKISCIHIDTKHNSAKAERMDELNLQLKEDYPKHDIKCFLLDDQDVFHGIKEYADQKHMNLLSFTVHKRGIFEKLFKPNLFKKILQESNVPILIFPS
jgi:nucleotide-binding universal stress UspA family protein